MRRLLIFIYAVSMILTFSFPVAHAQDNVWGIIRELSISVPYYVSMEMTKHKCFRVHAGFVGKSLVL